MQEFGETLATKPYPLYSRYASGVPPLTGGRDRNSIDLLEVAPPALHWVAHAAARKIFALGDDAGALDEQVPSALALERLREVSNLQDDITARRRDLLVGTTQRVLVDAPGVGRTYGECPEIDGIVRLDEHVSVGSLVECDIVASEGTDVVGRVK